MSTKPEKPKSRSSGLPNIVRPKSVLRVTSKGAETGAVTTHPSMVERIGMIHRTAQSKLRAQLSKMPGKGVTKGLR